MMFLIATALTLIHSFYAQECCRDRHCHPVACNEIKPNGDGWMWGDVQFTRAQLHKSPDGGCHVCIELNEPIGICIYLPPET
jgi:hypothetical protein